MSIPNKWIKNINNRRREQERKAAGYDKLKAENAELKSALCTPEAHAGVIEKAIEEEHTRLVKEHVGLKLMSKADYLESIRQCKTPPNEQGLCDPCYAPDCPHTLQCFKDLQAENAELQRRLTEAKEALDKICATPMTIKRPEIEMQMIAGNALECIEESEAKE